MQVALGTTIQAGWTKAIATSPNGSEWETIKNDSITKIMRTFIPNVKDSVAQRGYPYQDLAQVVIVFKDGTDVRFDVQKVSNQTLWRTAAYGGTAASVQAGLEQAVNDLTTWSSV